MNQINTNQRTELLEIMQVSAAEIPAIQQTLFYLYTEYAKTELADDTNERKEVTKAVESINRVLEALK